MNKRFTNRILLLIFTTTIISFNIIPAYSAELPAFTSPKRLSSEEWTVLWSTATLNEEARYLAEDSSDHSIIWAMKSGQSPEYEMTIACTYYNGTIKWYRKIEGLFNLSYSVPLGLVSNTEKGLAYVSFAFHNETSNWHLGILVINLTDGRIIKERILAQNIIYGAYPDANYEDRNAPLAISPNGDLLVAYAIRDDVSSSSIRLMYIDGDTLDKKAFYKLSEITGFPRQWPVKTLFYDSNSFILLMGADTSSNDDSRTLLIKYDIEDNAINKITELAVNLDSQSSLRPISMTLGNNRIYCAVKNFGAYVLRIVALDPNLQSIYKGSWLIEDMFWQDLAVYRNNRLLLTGFGTNSFSSLNQGQEQGVIMSILLDGDEKEFIASGIDRYGNPDYDDRMYGILVTGTGAIYVAGAGTSYGDTNTYSDFDAYLIKWQYGTEVYSDQSLNHSDDSLTDSCNCITKEFLMYTLMGAFIGLLSVIYLVDYLKKRNTSK